MEMDDEKEQPSALQPPTLTAQGSRHPWNFLTTIQYAQRGPIRGMYSFIFLFFAANKSDVFGIVAFIPRIESWYFCLFCEAENRGRERDCISCEETNYKDWIYQELRGE